jgi:tyrosinase
LKADHSRSKQFLDPVGTTIYCRSIQATMGPMAAGMSGMEPPVSSMHVYNPRCIRRDLNPYVSSKFFTTANLLNLTIKSFQDEFNGRPQDGGFMGLRKC